MIISGFQNTTLLDYPEKVAATVFLGGCNFRCPFCHNASIVLNPEKKYEEDDVLNFLSKRKNVLDGVCITGGEPSLQKDLFEFIFKIKSLGLAVKLDSNGYKPEVLERLYEGKLLDYIAMDIKSSPDGYAKAVGIPNFDMEPIKESVRIIKEGKIGYEFRTTLVKGIHELRDMEGIGRLIEGAEKYYLQSYTDKEDIVGKFSETDYSLSSFSEKELKEFRDDVLKYVPSTKIRGLDI